MIEVMIDETIEEATEADETTEAATGAEKINLESLLSTEAEVHPDELTSELSCEDFQLAAAGKT